MGENLEAAVRAIVFLILPGQLYSPPNEITENTSQSVMTEWLKEKKINFSDVWGVWYVICMNFHPPPVIKTAIKADTLPHKSTQEMIFFLWFQFDSAAMTPMEAGRRDALVCEIKVFSMIQTWQQARQKNTNFPLLPSFLCFWSCAPFCHFIWASEISHRRSHLLCLRLICLLTGSHQSLLRPGGIPSVWDKVWALGSTELSDSSYFSLSSCDEHRFLSFPSVMKSKVVEKCH